MCFKNLFKKKVKSQPQQQIKQTPQNYYQKKRSLMTQVEKQVFYNINEALRGTNLVVFPQINLATIIKKMNAKFQNELYRNIDFGVFDINTFEPLCMIELNDASHANANRYQRDLKVREILSACYLPLLTLYTDKPNKPEYIRQKVFEKIKSSLS